MSGWSQTPPKAASRGLYPPARVASSVAVPSRYLPWRLLCAAAALPLACSGSIENNSPTENAGVAPSPSADGVEATSPESAQFDFGETIEAEEDPGACVGQAYASRRVPVDLYFLVDTSGSMSDRVIGGEKWALMSEALVSFLERPENGEFGFGIGYFPAPPPSDCFQGDPACDCFPEFAGLCLPDPGGSCFVRDYSRPTVPLALPPAAAPLIASLSSRRLTGDTPTRQALEGAVSVASSWAAQHPDRRTVIVMATDGEPDGRCPDNDASDSVALAAEALTGPHQILTFVVGVGDTLTGLDPIAAAGGTSQAFLTDTSGDLVSQLGVALESIRNETSCDFQIPQQQGGLAVDPRLVNVRLNAPGQPGRVIGQTLGGIGDACGAEGGWYYDNPESPGSIRLCDSTCELTGEAVVEVEFGCSTVVNIR